MWLKFTGRYIYGYKIYCALFIEKNYWWTSSVPLVILDVFSTPLMINGISNKLILLGNKKVTTVLIKCFWISGSLRIFVHSRPLSIFWSSVNRVQLFHCVKSVRIWSCSGPHFSTFGLSTEKFIIRIHSVRMQENADQNNWIRTLFTQCWSLLILKNWSLTILILIDFGWCCHTK